MEIFFLGETELWTPFDTGRYSGGLFALILCGFAWEFLRKYSSDSLALVKETLGVAELPFNLIFPQLSTEERPEVLQFCF